MLKLILNPVVVSVCVLYLLCLKKVNVLLALILSALIAGLCVQMPFKVIMDTFICGMGDNCETALSYILLGAFAATMIHTGCANLLSEKITLLTKGKKLFLYLFLMLMAMASQTLVPIHIAFIPMVIPPLLKTMNKLQLDRRAVACILAFGLTMPYVAFPVGFGIIFQGLVLDNINQNGVCVCFHDAQLPFLLLGFSFVVGLVWALLFSYKKRRIYSESNSVVMVEDKSKKPSLNKRQQWIMIGAMILTFVIQLVFHSLPLGAIVGLSVLFVLKVVEKKALDQLMYEGIYMMGFVAFVMLAAAGFANVLKETGCIQTLASDLLQLLPANKGICAFCILCVGLIITMGIGSSFGTIPIITTVFVPVCLGLNFTGPQIIMLVTAAAALGDAGAPVSDTTLGPTAGLNVDGQHDHVKDTCVPTFLHYNIPLFLFALFAIIFDWV